MQHPSYPALVINVGGKAQPGAFYVTYQGHYLSHIAKDAYNSQTPSYMNRINKSKYNIAHCIYRKSSQSCSAQQVGGEAFILAQPDSFASQAWLSLCGKDKAGTDGLGSSLGFPYQVIWIPPLSGEEPEDLQPVEEEDPPSVVIPGIKIPSVVTIPKIITDIGGGSTITVPPITIGGGGGRSGITDDPVEGPDEPVPPPEEPEEPQKAGFPWWLGALLGAGALITVIVFATRGKGKKGKKGK